MGLQAVKNLHTTSSGAKLQEVAEQMPCNWKLVWWNIMPLVPMHRHHDGVLGKLSWVHTILYICAGGSISEAAPTEPCGLMVSTGPLLCHHAG